MHLRRYTTHLHPDFEADLRALALEDPDAAARMFAVLEEVLSDPESLDRLSEHRYQNDAIDVEQWGRQQRQRRNLWRVKLLELWYGMGVRRRIIYAFAPQRGHYEFLALTDKDFDYDDPSNALTQRIVRAYNDL